MSSMAHFNSAFNQPVGDCDTSSVTNMDRMFCNMFRYSNAFNQPIDDWDTSQVTNMSNMLHFNNAFNQPIGDCDTSSVTNMDICSKPVCSPQRPVGKPAHRPCNAQGPTANFGMRKGGPFCAEHEPIIVARRGRVPHACEERPQARGCRMGALLSMAMVIAL